jgi:hypothetical protein
MSKLIGYCAVDSGQIMLTDPCYLSDWEDDDAFSVREDLNQACKEDAAESYPYTYGGACAGSCNLDQAGQFEDKAGVVVSSGIGDGVYPVYVEYIDTGFAGRRVKSVTIDFWQHEEEDDD